MSVKFLIVENNRSVAQDLQGRLLNFGYEVAGICTSSHEAMQSINSLMPDMIIMNFRLQKGTDGIKTGELVQLKHAIPVIYMTENAGQATLRQAQDTGPFGYIFIPFKDRQIFSTLEIAILRNQFEKKIQKSQKWLTGVLNGIADGVVAINDQGQIRYIIQVGLDLTGWQQSDAIGRAFHEVVQLTDERTSTPIELIRDGQSLNKTDANPAFDAILTTQANKKIPVEVNVTMIAENYSSKSDMVIAFRNTQKQRDTLQEVQRQAERAQAL